jgi:hypothetical protein
MGKSLRSNVGKKIRTLNREKVLVQTKWVAEAEAKRLAVAAACAAAPPAPVEEARPPYDPMELEAGGSGRGRAGKPGKADKPRGAGAMQVDTKGPGNTRAGGKKGGKKGGKGGGVQKRAHKGPKILTASVHGAKRSRSKSSHRR